MANGSPGVSELRKKFETNVNTISEQSGSSPTNSREKLDKPPIAPKPKGIGKKLALSSNISQNNSLISSGETLDSQSITSSQNGYDSSSMDSSQGIIRDQTKISCDDNDTTTAHSPGDTEGDQAKPLDDTDTSNSARCSGAPSTVSSSEVGNEKDGEQEGNTSQLLHPCPNGKNDPQHVINEIITTERKFVEDLDALHECYDAMLIANSKNNLGLEKSIEEIFACFHQIRELHKNEFLPNMEKEYAYSTKPWIGEFFHNKSYIVKTYKPFLVRQEANKELLLDVLKHNEIKTAIADVLKDDMRLKLGFINIYNVIFQRITRYPNLLMEYLKRLPQDCPDRETAGMAMVKITNETRSTNEIKKNVEDFHNVLLGVLNRIVDGKNINLQAWEKFVKEGPVNKISQRRNERLQERYLFLFSGRLLVCRERTTGSFFIRHSMDVSTMQICDIKDPDKHPHSFRIKAKERIIDLKFESKEVFDDWYDTVMRVINEDRKRKKSFMNAGRTADSLASLGKQAPEWIKDEHCSMCMICFTKFTMMNRRHHCRACGKLVCGTCSPYKQALDYLDGAQEKICKNCKVYFDSGQEVDDKKKSSSPETLILEEQLGFSESNRQIKDCFVQLFEEGHLKIFNKIKDVKPLKQLPVIGYSLNVWPEIERCFRLSHRSCEYYFSAKTEESMKTWMAGIQKIMDDFTKDLKSGEPNPEASLEAVPETNEDVSQQEEDDDDDDDEEWDEDDSQND